MERRRVIVRLRWSPLLLALGLAFSQTADPPAAATNSQHSGDSHHPAAPRATSEELGRLTEAVARSLPSPADTDHDGMPDAWEKAHGLDPHDPADRNGDRDGDGYTNLEEYLNSLCE